MNINNKLEAIFYRMINDIGSTSCSPIRQTHRNLTPFLYKALLLFSPPKYPNVVILVL